MRSIFQKLVAASTYQICVVQQL